MDLGIGSRCGVSGCSTHDFLPFKCQACTGVFCLEHRTYDGHGCQRAHAKQQLAITCPVCRATLKLAGDEDPNAVWEQHQLRDGCDASKRKKRVRCPAPGKCKEVLGPTNTANCGGCGQNFCLRHRFKDDHACQGRPARGVAGWISAAPSPAPAPAPARRQTNPVTARPAPRRAPAPAPAANLNNTLRGSADRRRRGNGAPGGAYPGQAHRQHHQQEDIIDLTGDASPVRPPRAQQQQQPGVTVDGGCPFCGVVLHDAVALVGHVQSAHPEGGGGGGGGTRMPPEHSSYCHVG